MTTAPTRRQVDPDALAALEEQRDFLLRSLDDLEAEWDAGDLDESDYQALKDDYTARAAAVIRALDDRQARVAAAKPRRRPAVIAVWVAVVALAAIGAGVFVARSSGRREAGDVATGSVREDVDSRLLEGQQLAKDGNYDDALAKFDDVLADEPANVEALTTKGAVLIAADRYDEGIDVLQQAIQVDPTFLDPWSVLLLAQQRHDDQADGLKQIEDLAAGGDEDIALGVAQQLSAQEPVLAIMVYDSILAALPEQPVALTYRGWLVHLAGLDDESITYLDRAVAADPTMPDAQAFRAVVLNALGRKDEARQALAAFDALDPPDQMKQLVDQFGLRDELDQG